MGAFARCKLVDDLGDLIFIVISHYSISTGVDLRWSPAFANQTTNNVLNIINYIFKLHIDIITIINAV
ncbi:MAG: hypothetical protein ACI8PT_004318 [Gammaproteobacteria bacterium]|jgi:hypothetical protein